MKKPSINAPQIPEIDPQEVDDFLREQPFFMMEGHGEPEICDMTIAHEDIVFNNSVDFPNEIAAKGCTLWVKGNARFKGDVFNGAIIALGDIVFEKSVNISYVCALGNISINTCINSQFDSFEEIEVVTESDRSDLSAVGYIFTLCGTIRAGRLATAGEITLASATTLSSRSRLSLITGDRKLMIRKIRILEKKLEELKQKYEAMKTTVADLVKKLLERNMIGRRVPERDALQDKRDFMEAEVKRSEEYLQNLKNIINREKKPQDVKILNALKDEVHVVIENIEHDTTRDYNAVRFSPVGTEILPMRMDNDDVAKAFDRLKKHKEEREGLHLDDELALEAEQESGPTEEEIAET